MTNTKAPLPIQHMILTMGIRDNVKQLSKKEGQKENLMELQGIAFRFPYLNHVKGRCHLKYLIYNDYF